MCARFVRKRAAILWRQKRKCKCEEEVHCSENDTALLTNRNNANCITNRQVSTPDQSQDGAQFQQMQGILALPSL
jgi:hypothetical protein